MFRFATLLLSLLAAPATAQTFRLGASIPSSAERNFAADMVGGTFLGPEGTLAVTGDDRVYLFEGTGALDTFPTSVADAAVVLYAPTYPLGDPLGDAIDTNFGGDLGVGDVNADGYDDLLVSGGYFTEEEYFNPDTDAVETVRLAVRKVYVYYGGPGFDAVPDRTLIHHDVLPGYFSSWFGHSALLVADLGGTATPDVLVGDAAAGDFFGDYIVFTDLADGPAEVHNWTSAPGANASFDSKYGKYLAVGNLTSAPGLDLVVGIPGLANSWGRNERGAVEVGTDAMIYGFIGDAASPRVSASAELAVADFVPGGYDELLVGGLLFPADRLQGDVEAATEAIRLHGIDLKVDYAKVVAGEIDSEVGADALVWDGASGEVRFYSGGPTFGRATQSTFPSDGAFAIVGEANGDPTCAEVAVHRPRHDGTATIDVYTCDPDRTAPVCGDVTMSLDLFGTMQTKSVTIRDPESDVVSIAYRLGDGWTGYAEDPWFFSQTKRVGPFADGDVYAPGRPGSRLKVWGSRPTSQTAGSLSVVATNGAGLETTCWLQRPLKPTFPYRPLFLEGEEPLFALDAPAPNPVVGPATLSFSIPEAGPVRLVVYDALGREVAVAHDGSVEAGAHRVTWDASTLPAGTYVAVLAYGTERLTQRITVVR